MAMVFAAGGLTSLLSSVLMGRAVITEAEQLALGTDTGSSSNA